MENVVLFSFIVVIILFFYWKRIIRSFRRNNSDTDMELDLFLQTHTEFYKTLPPKMKKRFKHRLPIFIDTHEFEGREGLSVTEEMKLLISSAAVHLTLGLSDYTLSDFNRIFIYPDVYYSQFTKTTNRGETNQHGIITMAWPYVVDGFRDTTDKINLAYHEFAHALILQHVNTGLEDSMFVHGYELFCDKLFSENLSRKVEEMGLLREHAYANKMEFFAASTEFFLEAPELLHNQCSELYYLMVRMLRQDPVHQFYGLTFTYINDGTNNPY